jgi:hypothetical protein
MSELFLSFIARLEQKQGEPVTLSDEKSIAYLFEGELPLTATLSDQGNALVLDAWVEDTGALPAAERMALFGSLLELNALANLLNEAVFSLDEEHRIVLTRTLDLASLTPQEYLDEIAKLIEQVWQTRRLILAITP